MASLVAYDDSGSDISDSDEEHHQNIASNESSNISNNHTVESSCSDSKKLFHALPEPKTSCSKNTVYEEEDDEFLHKKETPSEIPIKQTPVNRLTGKKTTQIFLPSLSSFNDDDDEVQPAPKFKPSSKGTGLLNLLPQPKSIQNIDKSMKKAVTSLVPDSVKNKKIVNNNASKPTGSKPGETLAKTDKQNSNLLLIKYDSSDESDAESNDKGVDFFSLNKVQEKYVTPEIMNSAVESTSAVQTQCDDISPPVQNIPEETHHVEEVSYYPNHGEEVSSISMDIDNEALQKLAGSRAKRRGETMQIIDIHQKEILPDPREWLTKALTEETTKRTSASKRRGEEPTTQQRRKHQITYLAHQAKANEQELQNQWANNRLSKKQTQSKYGF